MRTGGKTAPTVRGACLAAGLAFLLGYAQTEDYLHIAISNVAVSIQADNASIRSVLEELLRQSNLEMMLNSSSKGDSPDRREVVNSTESSHHVEFCFGIIRKVECTARCGWTAYIIDIGKSDAKPPVQKQSKARLVSP